MNTKIPEFLEENLNNKNARPKYFSIVMKNFIIEYGNFYKYPNKDDLIGDYLVSLWFRYMKSNITIIGVCEINGCESMKNITKLKGKNTFKVSVGCCWTHTHKLSIQSKYGVDNVFQLKSTKKKITQTNLKKYGAENPSQNSRCKLKKKETLLEHYGVDHNMKSKHILAKRVKTYLSNFGVENPMQNAEIFEKAQQNSFRRKEYIWTSGEISLLQGYEPIVLKELENDGYKFNDILTSPKDMPEITYFFEGKEHRYYPDFYIPSENKIIEVKSDYTLQADWDKNQAKFEATRNLGFDFILEVR